jgi:hypothetical protein
VASHLTAANNRYGNRFLCHFYSCRRPATATPGKNDRM